MVWYTCPERLMKFPGMHCMTLTPIDHHYYVLLWWMDQSVMISPRWGSDLSASIMPHDRECNPFGTKNSRYNNYWQFRWKGKVHDSTYDITVIQTDGQGFRHKLQNSPLHQETRIRSGNLNTCTMNSSHREILEWKPGELRRGFILKMCQPGLSACNKAKCTPK